MWHRIETALGRTPIQRFTFFRLLHPHHLLPPTDDRIEIIAHVVGFESPSSFSNTSKKWSGWRPPK